MVKAVLTYFAKTRVGDQGEFWPTEEAREAVEAKKKK